MSYGLNKILKKILPRGLFYRSLIIVAAPIIILQMTISIVFFDSIWIKANKGMTKSLVGEIKILLDIHQSNNKNNVEFLTAAFFYYSDKNSNSEILLAENGLFNSA